MKLVIGTFICCAVMVYGAARGADGDMRAGSRMARDVCAQCHDTLPRPSGPHRATAAPDFRTIANSKQTSVVGLNAFLQTPHANMPNLILNAQDRANVIAYIMSLHTP